MFGLFGKKNFRKRNAKKVQPRFVLSSIQKQLIVGVLVFIGVALLITAIWYATRIESMQIRKVEVIGGFTIPHSQISEIAEAALKGTYFRLVPKRFELFYPKDEIENNIRAIDKVKNVHVELQKSDVLVIAFEEYKPFALWCERIDSTTCIYMDGTGYAFAQAPVLTGSAFVRYVQDDDVPEIGVAHFDNAFIEETKVFIEMLETSLSLYATHVHKLGDYDVEYHISGGGIIKTSQLMSTETSFQNLQTILTSEAFAHIAPGEFKYIDLRFGDKVFVNEVTDEEVIATSTEETIEETIEPEAVTEETE